MIDRAERGVTLVSPFVHIWPELKRAVARAVARRVRVTLITRGPQGAPSAEDLDVFHTLETEMMEVPGLHLKAYLSEKEALYTSANLTRQSIDKSLESAMLFDRALDTDGWVSVFEIWQKTIDDHARAAEPAPMAVETIFGSDARTRADAGDQGARDEHCYCIVCGQTASEEADQVVCLQCRAAAIADDKDPDDTVGRRCTRCNGEYRRSTVERPLCDACYRTERDQYERRPAPWYVAGKSGTIEAWWKHDSVANGGAAQPARARQEAVARRWGVMLPPGGWVLATLTASTTKPVQLWSSALIPHSMAGEGLFGIVAERVPSLRLPPCQELSSFDDHDALHLAYSRHEDPRSPSLWVPEDRLAAWDVDLPRNKRSFAIATPQWRWAVLLAPRASLPDQLIPDPDRVHLIVELTLGVPQELHSKWVDAVDLLLPLMLASLHSYIENDIIDLLGHADSTTARTIVGVLTAPAPLGPLTMPRSGNGRIAEIPHRSDRVVAIRATVQAAEAWHLTGTVSTAKKAQVH